jgi:hypothetical protein
VDPLLANLATRIKAPAFMNEVDLLIVVREESTEVSANGSCSDESFAKQFFKKSTSLKVYRPLFSSESA